MKYLVLTRSFEQNIETMSGLKDLLGESSVTILNEPQLIYQNINFDLEEIKKYKNIIITSSYAANILNSILNFKVNLFVIGKISHDLLLNNQFVQNIQYYNQVSDMILTLKELNLESYIYLSGQSITQHIDCKRLIIYNVGYKNSFTSNCNELITNGQKIIIIAMSINTAKSIISALKSINFNKKQLYIIAYSQKIAQEFQNFASNIYIYNKNFAGWLKYIKNIANGI